jgi:rod shape-determining protein MreC
VKVGSAVVYKDVLIGKVDKLTSIRSRVVLLTKSGWSFTVTTQKGVDGLLVLEGGNLVLKNVLVSDPLSVGDIVLTKGDQELSGGGFPPGLIVGKVESVEKKPSSLFQTARVESPLKITKLSTVFIVR